LCTLQYKSAIMNQLKNHNFYNKILLSNLNHFYVICIIIQMYEILLTQYIVFCFVLNPTRYNLHLINNLSF